jgi:NAD(P)-dependent dehydrogenase (short-subunit alcohol dehydrogenase family)/rhamnose utilization protein RhaD (predicted bifunctional aldolase and dehydrogenase)
LPKKPMHTFELLSPETLENELSLLIDEVHRVGSDSTLTLPGSSSFSLKRNASNASGEGEEILFINNRYERFQEASSENYLSFLNGRLTALLRYDQISVKMLEFELLTSQLSALKSIPPINIFLHAAIPAACVCFTQPVSLAAIASTDKGKDLFEEIFKNTVEFLEYRPSGLPLARSVAQALESNQNGDLCSLYVMNQGLITFGAEPFEAFERVRTLNEQASQYLVKHNAQGTAFPFRPEPGSVNRQELAALRNRLSQEAGKPLILKSMGTLTGLDFGEPENYAGLGPVFPAHLPGYRYDPLMGRDVDAYVSAHQDDGSETGDRAPRIVLDPELGMCSAGRTVKESVENWEFFTHNLQSMSCASRLGSFHPLTREVFAGEKRLEAPLLVTDRLDDIPIFTGEIALVTGAASGIGKACAKSCLERGAAVVGLDLSASIVGLFDTENFLGIICDVADEKAVKAAVDQTVLAFGGLDMLVLNAGIFPAGCRIDAMGMEEWEKVMSINLHGNMALMRETFVLLKLAPGSGRVVINGSRNVKAPGPGASAYSASKAALTQLARVAALEWGKDGIRVNVVHPNAVFDTALYTEEVLAARAASYGITVDQYKKNNVLRVEVTSRDVGEMVAEMCGPLFAKITGAQVSIDGGSDRVI